LKTGTNYLAEMLGIFPCKPKIFRKRVRKAIINGGSKRKRSVAKIV
jgi:hypothetical protein